MIKGQVDSAELPTAFQLFNVKRRGWLLLCQGDQRLDGCPLEKVETGGAGFYNSDQEKVN
jgi:hypothetical protein